MKANTYALLGLLALIVGFALGALTYRAYTPFIEVPIVEVRMDTVVVRDTLRLPVPPPRRITEVRTDTLYIATAAGDTVTAELPVTQVEYSTLEYKAILEGYKPRLVSMEVYPKTITINRVETVVRRPRWGVTAGVGGGYDGNKFVPHLGVTVGWVVWSK